VNAEDPAVALWRAVFAPPPEPPRLIGDAEMVAVLLGISPRTVQRLTSTGVFEPIGKRLTGRRGRPPHLYDLTQVQETWAERKAS
jgi:predicted ArsR family transcriptional regulator